MLCAGLPRADDPPLHHDHAAVCLVGEQQRARGHAGARLARRERHHPRGRQAAQIPEEGDRVRRALRLLPPLLAPHAPHLLPPRVRPSVLAPFSSLHCPLFYEFTHVMNLWWSSSAS